MVDVDAACGSVDGALSPLYWLESAVSRLSSTKPVHTMAAPVRELIRAMAMFLGERHALVTAAALTDRIDGSLCVRMRDLFVTHVAAAAHVDAGLLLSAETNGETYVANVLTELPFVELGADAGQMAADAAANELYELLGTLRDGKSTRGRRRAGSAALPSEPVSDSLIRKRLNEVQSEHHIKPFFAVDVATAGPLASNGKARTWLKTQFDVDVVLCESINGLSPEALKSLKNFESEVKETVMKIIRALDAGESSTAGAGAKPAQLRKVFISYSQADGTTFLAMVQGMLNALPAGSINVWSDERMQAGDDWPQEIDAGMADAACAVFILTKGFLNSTFIQNTEVPRLLEARKTAGLRVIPVIARNCPWKQWDSFKSIQAFNGTKALNAMSEAEQDDVLTKLAETIHKYLQQPAA